MKPAVTMMVGLMLGWGANTGTATQVQKAGDQQAETPGVESAPDTHYGRHRADPGRA